jgi:hypothetical protein
MLTLTILNRLIKCERGRGIPEKLPLFTQKSKKTYEGKKL